jgi:hypothetical protein
MKGAFVIAVRERNLNSDVYHSKHNVGEQNVSQDSATECLSVRLLFSDTLLGMY